MSNRYDFYGPIHKGLRYGAAKLVARIGSLDLSDLDAVDGLVADLGEFLVLAKAHLEHEDREIHALLRMRAPAMCDLLEHEHADHCDSFAQLDLLLAGLGNAGPELRSAALRALYIGFSKHVAADLAHMAREEEETLPLLQSLYTDEDLAAVETRIVACIPPDQMLAYLRLMLPAATPSERVRLLKEIKAGAPSEVFDVILDQAARPSLSVPEWRAVEVEFGLAA
jgi:hypothetical protein